MSRDTTIAHCRRVLAEKSESFDRAAPFLPADRRDDAAVVYAFCRTVDDTADECDDPERARRQLRELRGQLDGEHDRGPVVDAFVDVADRRGIDLECARELIDGVSSDLGRVRFETDRELLRYCYRVAGTVGLMMAPLLGVDDPRAHPYAVDLGIGMQLTNICRDVAEDADNGRVYLPAERLRDAGVDPAALVAQDADKAARRDHREGVSRVVDDLLDLADRYYSSARDGYPYIPARSRLAILLAARRYRQIGEVLRRRGGDPFASRARVSGTNALRAHTGSLLLFFATLLPSLRDDDSHRASLHRHLDSLPGTHAPSSPLLGVP